ncbi:hypothetical protein EON64_01205 [archaeon]|nr:MAG: hypothetical protein EON64_01205 [archaeon]
MVFWGNPTTTGSENVDFFISSDIMEDPWATRRQVHEVMYSEQVVRLGGQGIFYYPPLPPHTILEQVNMLQLIKGVEFYTRAQFGLPDEGFVYMLPQSLFKLHPLFDFVIVQLLVATPANVHFLCTGGRQQAWTEAFRARLLSRFAAVDRAEDFWTRVHFAERVSSENFLNLLLLADVILHPFPFDGSRTSADAIIVDKPYVTLPTMYLRGRMGYAFYRSMNLPDLVAVNVPDYLRILLRLHDDREFYDNVVSMLKARKDLIWHDMETVYEWTRFFQAATLESNHYASFEEFLTASFRQQQGLLRQHSQHLGILQHYSNWTVDLELERTLRRRRNMQAFDLQYRKRLHDQHEIGAIESEENFLVQLNSNEESALSTASLSRIIYQHVHVSRGSNEECTHCRDVLPWPQLFKHWHTICASLKLERDLALEGGQYMQYCQVLEVFRSETVGPSVGADRTTSVDNKKLEAKSPSRGGGDLFRSFHDAIRQADYAEALHISDSLRSSALPSDVYTYMWRKEVGNFLLPVTSSFPMLLLETGLAHLQLGQYVAAHNLCTMASKASGEAAHPVLSYVCINLAGLYVNNGSMEDALQAGLMAYQQLATFHKRAEQMNVTVLALFPYSPFSVPPIQHLELNILAAYKRFGQWQSCLDVASSLFDFFTYLHPSSRLSADNQRYLSTYFVLLSFIDWHPSHRSVLDHVQSLMETTHVWPYYNVSMDAFTGVPEDARHSNVSRQVTLYDIVQHVKARGDHLLNMLISCLHSAQDSRISKLLNDISFDIMIMIRLVDQQAKQKEAQNMVSRQHVEISRDQQPIVLVCQYYLSSSAVRQHLNDMVLRKNMRNPSISQIFLLTEELIDLSMFYEFEDSQKLIQVVLGERLTFQSAFRFANSRLVGKTVIVSNADIYFDQSLALLLEHPLPSNTVLAILKWIDHLPNEDGSVASDELSHISLQLRTDSQDSWVFNPPLPDLLLTEDTAFPLGVPRCDNRIALLFEKAGMQIYNPALFIHAIEIQPRDLYAGDRGQANLYSHERSINLPGRNVYLLDSLRRLQTPA